MGADFRPRPLLQLAQSGSLGCSFSAALSPTPAAAFGLELTTNDGGYVAMPAEIRAITPIAGAWHRVELELDLSLPTAAAAIWLDGLRVINPTPIRSECSGGGAFTLRAGVICANEPTEIRIDNITFSLTE